MKSQLRRLSVWLLISLIVFFPTLLPVHGAPLQGALDLNNIQRATVQIMQMYTNPVGDLVVSCIGTGTIVSKDGLILTNAHLAESSPTCRTDRIVIALTLRIGEPPAAEYYAEEVGHNVGWDLAVLQITGTLDHRAINRANLALPFVSLADSDAAQLDDTIRVVGYATSDNSKQVSSIDTVLVGTISGFTAESLIGDHAWIKTRLAIPGSISGGGAYDTDGNLVGIPTIGPLRGDMATADCRHVQPDSCIPVSGYINALRPARLARGLILAAKLGVSATVQLPPQQNTNSTVKPAFSRLFFAPGIDIAGMPTSVITSLAAGASSLYLFFDYANMTDGIIYELRVLHDGVPDATFSLSPATWSGGKRGMWYIGSTAQVWPNGTYDFSLFIDGVRADSRKITVGGPAQNTPLIQDVLFGVIDSENNNLVGTGNMLPVANIVNAEFAFNNMAPTLNFRQVWYYEGLKFYDNSEVWKYGPNGKQRITGKGSDKQPLQPGRYRLEVWLGDQMAATSDFIMAGSSASLPAQAFKKLSFASELNANQPAGIVGATFTRPITRLYATFDWQYVAVDTPWTWRWTVDGNPLFEVTQPWTGGSTGSNFWVRLDGHGPIPDGSYKVDLLLGGVVRATATAKVGLGQLPLTVFSSAAGVQVQGRIIDAETKQGIPGVAIIVLKDNLFISDFTWDMSQVFDMTLTDSAGQFALTKLLPRDPKGRNYSVLVVARGYLPLSTDTLKIDPKTKSPLNLPLELNKD